MPLELQSTKERETKKTPFEMMNTVDLTCWLALLLLLGLIVYMKCGLLRSMILAFVSLSVSLSVSRGFTEFHCAKNGSPDRYPVSAGYTFGEPRHIVLDGGPDFLAARGGGFDAAFAKLLWSFVLLYDS